MQKLPGTPGQLIDILNIITLSLLFLFFILFRVYTNPYILYMMFLLFMSSVNFREPLFAEYFNKRSRSYNRATTLSLTNLLRTFLDIPLMFGLGLVVAYNILLPYYAAFILAFIAVIFFSVSKYTKDTATKIKTSSRQQKV